MFKNISLRNKAIAFAIALGTLPVIAIGVTNYISSSNSIRQNTIKSQEALAFAMADKVNRFMFERNADIQVLANLSILTNPEATAEITLQQKQSLLDKYMKIYGFYDSIAVADAAGNTILQTSGEAITGLGERDYFKQAITTKKPVITSPRKSKLNGKYSIFIAAPIFNANTGKLTGVVRTRIPIENVDAILAAQEAQLANKLNTSINAEYYLVGPDNKFFVAKQTKQLGRDASADFAGFAQMKAAKSVTTMVDINPSDQAEKLVSYVPTLELQGMQPLNWSVLLAEDTAVTFAAERQLLLNLFLGTGVTALIASGLAIVFANRTTNLIKKIASAIAASSTEIATTVEQQERTVSQQAISVTQTTTTMDQLGASSGQSAQQAEASAAGAQQALSLAENGAVAVQETLEGMSMLKQKVGGIAEQILRLCEQTQQIGGISGLVGDLANQTNMLALNAAVEAARAGSHGKGFGVVAGEIRKLADQSKKSAEKINALVGDIQSVIDTTVMVTDEGTKNVDSSMKLTQLTAETFTGVADAINNVFLNSQQISLNAKQQAVAVQQVVAAMNEINLGAKESASGITQVKASTQQLKDTAHNLKALV